MIYIIALIVIWNIQISLSLQIIVSCIAGLSLWAKTIMFCIDFMQNANSNENGNTKN